MKSGSTGIFADRTCHFIVSAWAFFSLFFFFFFSTRRQYHYFFTQINASSPSNLVENFFFSDLSVLLLFFFCWLHGSHFSFLHLLVQFFPFDIFFYYQRYRILVADDFTEYTIWPVSVKCARFSNFNFTIDQFRLNANSICNAKQLQTLLLYSDWIQLQKIWFLLEKKKMIDLGVHVISVKMKRERMHRVRERKRGIDRARKSRLSSLSYD